MSAPVPQRHEKLIMSVGVCVQMEPGAAQVTRICLERERQPLLVAQEEHLETPTCSNMPVPVPRLDWTGSFRYGLRDGQGREGLDPVVARAGAVVSRGREGPAAGTLWHSFLATSVFFNTGT